MFYPLGIILGMVVGTRMEILSTTYRDREQTIETFNGSIRGDNYLWGLNLAWGLAFGQSSAEYPYDYEMIFVEPSGMNPVPAFRSNPEQLINYAVNNFSAA